MKGTSNTQYHKINIEKTTIEKIKTIIEPKGNVMH